MDEADGVRHPCLSQEPPAHARRGQSQFDYWCLLNKRSFCASICPAVQQQKLLSRP